MESISILGRAIKPNTVKSQSDWTPADFAKLAQDGKDNVIINRGGNNYIVTADKLDISWRNVGDTATVNGKAGKLIAVDIESEKPNGAGQSEIAGLAKKAIEASQKSDKTRVQQAILQNAFVQIDKLSDGKNLMAKMGIDFPAKRFSDTGTTVQVRILEQIERGMPEQDVFKFIKGLMEKPIAPKETRHYNLNAQFDIANMLLYSVAKNHPDVQLADTTDRMRESVIAAAARLGEQREGLFRKTTYNINALGENIPFLSQPEQEIFNKKMMATLDLLDNRAKRAAPVTQASGAEQ